MKKLKIEDLFPLHYIQTNAISLFKGLSRYDQSQEVKLLEPFIYDNNSTHFVREIFLDYAGFYSANKVASKFFYKIVEECCRANGYSIDGLINHEYAYADILAINESLWDIDAEEFAIVEMIYQRFAVKWNKIYTALMTAYKPLENYDMTEKDSPNLTKTRSVNTDLTTSTDNDITDTDIYGFNSSSPNPSGKITRNGDVHVTGDAENNIETESETGYRDLTRHGNIGVTTSQQMLQSELEVRKYDFYKMIYNDIDSILCLKVY